MKPTLLLIAALFLTACAHTPLGAAKSDIQYIQATYDTVAPVAEAAADIVENDQNPMALRRVLQCVLVRSGPVFTVLHDADLRYDDIKAKIAAGTSTQDQLNAAIDELHKAEGSARIPFNTLVKALAGLPVACGA